MSTSKNSHEYQLAHKRFVQAVVRLTKRERAFAKDAAESSPPLNIRRDIREKMRGDEGSIADLEKVIDKIDALFYGYWK